MKRALVMSLVLSLLVAGLVAPAEAGKKKKKPKRVQRVVEHSYDVASPGIPGVIGACLAAQMDNSGCINIPTGGNEKFVTVEVSDASGTPPSGILGQDTDTSNTGFEIFHTFCGGVDEPVAIPQPGAELRVSVYLAPAPGCSGIGTSGDFKVTLSNLP
jgi:hypothetical protein